MLVKRFAREADTVILDIKEPSPPLLTMAMDSLRPDEVHLSDDDEVVLLIVSEEPPESVTGRWRLTAEEINDVFKGQFTWQWITTTGASRSPPS